MTAEVVWGTDFRSKKIRQLTPQQELEQLACELMDVIWNPHERAIYEAPEKDPA